MKSETKAALLAIRENIEMELFSSEEGCIVIQTQEEKVEYKSDPRYREHPLVIDSEEEPEPELQTQRRQQAKPKSEPPTWPEIKQCRFIPAITEEVMIEMKVVPPFQKSQSELVELSSNKVSRLKWKRQTPHKTGLVVRDVVCLPRGHCLAQGDRRTIPHIKGQSSLVAVGMTARITIDSSWTASQMHSRLALLFRGLFIKDAGRRFSFTYLQCVQGSRVLFVPDTPAEGWTGKQVLRISEHSALYILSHHDYLQEEPVSKYTSKRSVSTRPVNRKSYLEAATKSSPAGKKQTGGPAKTLVSNTTGKVTLNLDTMLSQFRQENLDQDGKTHIHVRRKDLLHSTLEAMRAPGFSFRKKPIIIFTGEETDHEEPLREFFRSALMELQKSPVFEGPPGRVFLTYDLTALEEGRYYEAGFLIGWSLAHGGPGPRCLHPALYQLMCGLNPSLGDFNWTDISDTEAQLRLQQLQGCADVKQLSPSLRDWMSSCGINGISSGHCDEIAAMYSRLVKHYIYHRVASMISQFKEGLNSCGGLWDMVQSHWEMFVPVMTNTQQEPLTLEEVKQLFTVCYSNTDHQLRAEEEATAEHWETVLTLVRDGEADFSFEDLLTFISGADHLHPLGFSSQIFLRFYTQDTCMSSVRLPYTSSSAFELFLPRGVGGAADLSTLLSRAVHGAQSLTHLQTEGEGGGICIL